MTIDVNRSPVRMIRPVETHLTSVEGIKNKRGVGIRNIPRADIFQPDAFSWRASNFYSYGAEVQVSGNSFDTLGSEGNIAYRRSLELNRPNVRTRLDQILPGLTVEPRGNLGNIYRCVIPNRGINPDVEELQKADPNHPKFSGRAQSDPEGFVPPSWAFVRKIATQSMIDESPSHANGIRDRMVLTLTGRQASDTFAAIGIVGTSISISYRSRVPIGTGSFFRSASLSNREPPSTWGELLTVDPDYAQNYIFRGLPSREYTLNDPLVVTIDNANGFARLGQAVLGRELVLGLGDASALNISAVDYSPVILDDYGNVDRTIRNTADEENVGVKILRNDIAFLKSTFKDYRAARPAVFTVGNNERNGATVYGYINGFNITPDTRTDDLADLKLDIQGLA